MAYEMKDNSGSIFKNDRKDKPNHPDRTGTALIDGVEYWISGWIKNGKNGDFLSLAFKRKDGKPVDRSAGDRSRVGAGNDMNDDIPFAPEFR